MAHDWDKYARHQPIDASSYRAEPTQWLRVQRILDRAVGSVLDVGAADGYISRRLQNNGHTVQAVEASLTCCQLVAESGTPCVHASSLEAIESLSWDTVLLGEVLEHCADPGMLLKDAYRIAGERVIITVPLLGWADPTHEWRISLDHIVTDDWRDDRPATSEQIVLTWQRGTCWPIEYWKTDPKWHEQFRLGH